MDEQSQEVVKYLGRGVRLSNNNLMDVNGLFDVMLEILETPLELTWVDLSFNNIASLSGLSALPENLTVLYLHANNITSLNEVAVLLRFTELRTLTLYGNPIEDIKNYRFCILSMFPKLKTFDKVTVTDRDKQTAEAYRAFFWPKAVKNKTK